AGIVDERAERAELVRRCEDAENVGLVADVAFHRDRLAVGGFDFRNHLVGRGLIAGIADHDAKAAHGGRKRGGAADAAAPAGDDDDLVGHSCPRRAIARWARLARSACTEADPACKAAGDNCLQAKMAPTIAAMVKARFLTISEKVTRPDIPLRPQAHKSSTRRAGSSRLSLTRTRKVTASLPSMT